MRVFFFSPQKKSLKMNFTIVIFVFVLLQTINYNSPRGGISVETNTSGNIPRSYLLIDSVAPSDSGKYSCHPANAKDVSVTVHIQDGK